MGVWDNSAEGVAYRKKYYLDNKASFIARAKSWAENNKDRRKAIALKWAREHAIDRYKAETKYRKAKPHKYLLALAGRRAKKLGREFTIDLSDIVIPTLCPLLGIEINIYADKIDYHPSVDRIDPKKGYVKGNVWIISQRANRIKSDCDPDELLMIYCNLMEKIG